MSDDRNEREELEALRAYDELPAPAMSEEVRAKARRAFLHGEEAEGSRIAGGGAASRTPAPRRGGLLRGVRIGGFAAAAAAFAFFFFGGQPTESWRIVGVVEPAGVAVDAPSMDVGAVVSAGTITTGPDSELQLQLGRRLRLNVRPNTRFELPAGPGRWRGKDRTLVLHEGEVYGSSHGPLGFEFHMRTPEAHARLMGTTFAIIRAEDATCFCLFEGALCIQSSAGEPVHVDEGKRVFVYGDGRPPFVDDLTAPESMKLQMLYDAGPVEGLD